MSPDIQDALTGAGLDTADSTSRRLDAEQVKRASLVLVAERTHRPAVVAQVPSGLGRTFTIREFDRSIAASDTAAISGTPADRMAALVGVAAALRGALPPPSPRDDDPYLGGAAAAQIYLEKLTSHLDGWTAVVAGQPFAWHGQLATLSRTHRGRASRNGHLLHAHHSVGREGILRGCTQTVSWQITASWVGCQVSARPVYLLRRSSV